MYPKMKRKVAKSGGFRLSPNEEALLLKEEYDRRRKLRLQQVREQERNIALHIRQDVKQRRDEQLHQLAAELKLEWQKAQQEKIKALEKLYLSSLRAIGEGHRQAKENEPDWEALAKQADERKQRAEQRHKEALKEQKSRKEKLLREQTWRANARKYALNKERERAAKIASLPPPPPPPFENIELKSAPAMKVCDADNFSVTRRHLFEPYVDREMDIEQPDARLLAEEEAKRQEGLQTEEERGKREQLEKAHLRGRHALKMVRLAQDREKLMKELEQMQTVDLARRRQIVARMPPQLFEAGYRRLEIKEEWQRDMECAFEDMYTGERKMKGDIILHLDPQPLPAFSSRSPDNGLDLSQELDPVCQAPPKLEEEGKDVDLSCEPGLKMEPVPHSQSNLALKKLLNKIRNQKDQWTSRNVAETQSEVETIESGTITSRERRLCESEPESDPICHPVPDTQGQEVLPEILDQTVLAGNSVFNHPQEQAAEIGKEAEIQKQVEWLEHQKQQQLDLLQQAEEQRIRLEVDCLRTQMQHQEKEIMRDLEKNAQPSEAELMKETVPVMNQKQKEQGPETTTESQATCSSGEDNHLQKIRDYQQRLLMQSRMHQESIEDARKHLQEYQSKLKQRYSSVSAVLLGSALAPRNSVPEPPSLQLHGSDVMERLNETACQISSAHAPVQELAQPEGHSEPPWALAEPLDQRHKEQRFDTGSRRPGQPFWPQMDPSLLQMAHVSSSNQQTVKLDGAGTRATQPVDSPWISGSSVLKAPDVSVRTQPVVHTQQVRFTLPAESSSQLSETSQPNESVSPSLLAEKSLQVTSSKQQCPTAQNKILTTVALPLEQPPPSVPPPVAGEAGGTKESLALRSGNLSSSSYSEILLLREQVLASSKSIQAQQEYLKKLQEQLDEQKEALLSRQRMQEDLLLHKHAQLKKQMEQQKEALEGFLKEAGQSSVCRERTQAQDVDNFSLLTMLTSEQEEVNVHDTSSHVEGTPVFQSTGSELFQNTCRGESKWRPSKPPLAKVKLGIDLVQHELSAIPELDTPQSGRISATGHNISVIGSSSPTFEGRTVCSSKRPNESVSGEAERFRIPADIEEQRFSESPSNMGQLTKSWFEKSMMKTSRFHHQGESTLQDQSLPSYPVAIGQRGTTYPPPSFRPDSTEALTTIGSPGLKSPRTCAQEGAASYLSASALSATSFITDEKFHRSLASTGPYPSSKESRHFNSPVTEKANALGDPSVSLLCKQDDLSQPSDVPGYLGETQCSHRSKIQMIIDKYIRDTSWSSLSSLSRQDPAAGLDVPDSEKSIPSANRELFQPLEPNFDSDTFSSFSQCLLSLDSKDLSKISGLSDSPQLTTSCFEDQSSIFSFLDTGRLSSILQTEVTGMEGKEQIQGTEEVFEHLPVTSTFSKLRLSSEKPGDFSSVSEQNYEVTKSVEGNICPSPDSQQCEVLQGEDNIPPQSPIENLRSREEDDQITSFYQLIPEYGAIESTFGMTRSEKEGITSREESLCFVELPATSINRKLQLFTENALLNESEGPAARSLGSVPTTGQGNVQAGQGLGLPQEMNSGISVCVVQNLIQQSDTEQDACPQPSSNNVNSDFCLLKSSILVGTQAGQGIMEEPELTLISSTDISIAESDLDFFSQADSRKVTTENLSCKETPDIKSPKSRRLFPLNPGVNNSISVPPDNHPPIAPCHKKDWCEKHNPMELAEFTTVPGSLQESFLKRKKDFIERSSKRLEKLKSREQSSRKSQVEALQQKRTKNHKPKENPPPPPGATATHLNKVEEIKIRTAHDRKTAEAQMHHRTSRLYNNLAEVKIKKEERDRQETYAKNREKAKAFQKKTLEKLRARKPQWECSVKAP